jgi:hypothetical protein
MRRLSILALLFAFLAIGAGPAAAVDYLLEVQAGGPGTVTPPGPVSVPAGGSQTFTFSPTPSGCNAVLDVTVDDVSVGSGLTEYTFTNVQSDHVLYVSFGPQTISTATALDVRPVFGQCAVPETLTATVPNADGGQVQFFKGATLLGARPLTAGVATYVVSPGLPTGSYTFSADYLGTNCSSPSNSPVVVYDVTDTGPTPVTLSLTLSSNSLDQFTSVGANATLRIGGDVAVAQNGQVTFYDGGVSLGSTAMTNGHSFRSFQMDVPGEHVLTAVASLAQCPGTITSEPESLFVRVTAVVDTTLWVTNGLVRSVVVDGNTIYIGGDFTQVSPTWGGPWTQRNHLAALDALTGSATSWNPDANGSVRCLAVGGSTVYAGGDFTSIGGQPCNYIAGLDATTGAATAYPNSNGSVLALAMSGSTVYAGGEFTSIGGQPRSHIAALDLATGAATAWNPGVNEPVYALAASGGTIYVGGAFLCIGLDATSGAATAFDPDPQGDASGLRFPTQVISLAVSGNTVYAGGNFTSIGGKSRFELAALDATTGSATAWNPGTPYGVIALAVSGSTVYVGGGFIAIGGAQRHGLAALDPVSGHATPWNPGDASAVFALAVSGGKVYAGGGFTSMGGQPRAHIAAIFEPDFLVSVSPSDPQTPRESDLTLLSSNPTSGSARVQYSVSRAGRVRVEVLDVSGRVEQTLADRIHTPGRYVVNWDGVGRRGRSSPGLYFIRLVTPDQAMTRKLAIIR